MKKGDKVIFTGYEYNIAKIFKYNELFKDKVLTIENVIECPCDKKYMNKLKFEGVSGYYRASFFKKVEV